LFALGGFGEFLPGLVALELRLGLAFAQGSSCFCQVGAAGLFGFAQGGLGFLQAGLLGGQVAFEFDALAGAVLVGVDPVCQGVLVKLLIYGFFGIHRLMGGR